MTATCLRTFAIALATLPLAAPLGGQTTPAPVPPAPPAGHTLVWSDEFDRDGRPDPKNWTYETGFVRNQEHQWYQPENARVEGGRLIIEGRRERRPNPRYEDGSNDWRRNREVAEYTSASLLTRGLHSWQYGSSTSRSAARTAATRQRRRSRAGTKWSGSGCFRGTPPSTPPRPAPPPGERHGRPCG